MVGRYTRTRAFAPTGEFEEYSARRLLERAGEAGLLNNIDFA